MRVRSTYARQNQTRDTTHGGAGRPAPAPVCRKRPFTTQADRLRPRLDSRRLPVRLEFPILSLNPGSRQRCVASGLRQRGTQPRVVEGPHAVDLRRRPHGGPCRTEQCPLGLPLPGLGPAPSGGLTTNSRRTPCAGGAWPALLVTLRRSHTTGMQSKVHPTYKTKYRVANWPAYNQALVRGVVA